MMSVSTSGAHAYPPAIMRGRGRLLLIAGGVRGPRMVYANPRAFIEKPGKPSCLIRTASPMLPRWLELSYAACKSSGINVLHWRTRLTVQRVSL